MAQIYHPIFFFNLSIYPLPFNQLSHPGTPFLCLFKLILCFLLDQLRDFYYFILPLLLAWIYSIIVFSFIVPLEITMCIHWKLYFKRFNSHTKQFIHVKGPCQCYLVYSQVCPTVLYLFGTFLPPHKETGTINCHSLPLLQP